MSAFLDLMYIILFVVMCLAGMLHASYLRHQNNNSKNLKNSKRKTRLTPYLQLMKELGRGPYNKKKKPDQISRVIVQYKNRNVYKWNLIVLGFVMCGAASGIVEGPSPEYGPITVYVGAPLFLLLGFFSIYYWIGIMNKTRPLPRVIFSHKGIKINGPLRTERVLWGDIKDIKTKYYSDYGDVIVFELFDQKQHERKRYSRMGLLGEIFQRAFLKSDVTIIQRHWYEGDKAIPDKEVYNLVIEEWDKYKSRQEQASGS